MVDRIGQQLGNYTLVRLLGQGGFADVYLAEHIHLNTHAAMKVSQTSMNQQELQRFTQEARTVAQLKHPHIIRILDFGLDGSTPYLVMDYLPRGTLRDLHPCGTTLPLPVVVHYIDQLASALQYAHDQKLVHRDMKPENILVEGNDHLIVSDFGLVVAAHKTASLSTQEAIGTVTYMAPEQIQGKARPASDQYALGVLAYEWLSGTPPFDGDTSIEVAMQHLTTPPPSLSVRVSALPGEVERVIMKALSKDPHNRYATVQEFASALKQAAGFTSTLKRPPTLLASIKNALKQAADPAASTPGTSNTPTVQPPVKAPPPSRPVAPVPAQPVVTPAAPGTSSAHQRGELLRKYLGHHGYPGGPYGLAWSPDSIQIASGNDRGLHVWHATTGQRRIFTEEWTRGLCWSPDGTLITAVTGSSHKMYDAHSGKCVFSRPISRPTIRYLHVLAGSPDGRYVALVNPEQAIQIWDIQQRAVRVSINEHNDDITALCWSPDNRFIASTSGDRQVCIWSVDGQLVNSFTDVTFYPKAIAWSPNGIWLACGGQDFTEATLCVWNVQSSNTQSLWDTDTGTVNAIAWSPDGRYFATGDDAEATVNIWDAATGDGIFSYEGHQHEVEALAWSPDGTRIVSFDGDSIVHVWWAL